MPYLDDTGFDEMAVWNADDEAEDIAEATRDAELHGMSIECSTWDDEPFLRLDDGDIYEG